MKNEINILSNNKNIYRREIEKIRAVTVLFFQFFHYNIVAT